MTAAGEEGPCGIPACEVTDEQERLAAFRAAHPTAVIDTGNLTVHVGGMPVTAPTVAELLDKLDVIASIPGG